MYLVTWAWRNEVKMLLVRNCGNLKEARAVAMGIFNEGGKLDIQPIVFGIVRQSKRWGTEEHEDVAMLWDSEK